MYNNNLHEKKPGDDVWIIERNEEGLATEYNGYLFLAMVGETVIASAHIRNYDIEKILNYHVAETAKSYYTNLSVFPAEDCFADRELGQKAFIKMLS